MDDEQIEAATVEVLTSDSEGCGVYIGGAMIATAAHCLQWQIGSDGLIAHASAVRIVSSLGFEFKAIPIFADIVADIAILGPVGESEPAVFQDRAAFTEFGRAIDPIPMLTDVPGDGPPITVRVRTNAGSWMRGVALAGDDRRNWMQVRLWADIPSGSSGGPIVDCDGRLVGVVSDCCTPRVYEHVHTARVGVIARCLPPWVLGRV
jgi:S1-C subfamily serine protease